MNEKSPIHNSRGVRVYFEYLSRYYPDVDIDAILEYAEMTKHQVADPGHWFTQHQIERKDRKFEYLQRGRPLCSFLRGIRCWKTIRIGIDESYICLPPNREALSHH